MKRLLLVLGVCCLSAVQGFVGDSGPGDTVGGIQGTRHRVVVSTDIGGTDPDDFQSMVHLLVYADVLDIEGIISSPFGPGRKEHILQVIDCYAEDYANLKTYSDRYPTPDALRAIAKQGETERAPYAGVRGTTEGSEWIVRCARRDDPRPLHVLVWGGIEDLAQALHDARDIQPKLRVYWIGGPNKKWAPDAYQYIVENHPKLWIIEANATYRGWFVGGNQEGPWNNRTFVATHVAGHGALGDFFAGLLGGTMKMGDTPSVGWLLKGTPEDPSLGGWGGRFVRAWERPYVQFTRLTTAEDRMEHFGVLELVLPLGSDAPEEPEGRMVVENQSLIGHADGQGNLRFRFCSRDAKEFRYTIRSNVPSLDGKSGQITSVAPHPSVALHASPRFPNWWTDDPAPQFAEGPHIGAKTVSRWREEFLGDFSQRMLRCQALAATEQTPAASVPGQAPPLPPVLPDGIPAFPGAWGGGMFATGGRGGKVIQVTTLADSGPGSLRAAIGQEDPRIVVFRVAGIIHLESNLDIDSPDITIAGQSAPGDGICLAGHSLNINTRNVILRHLRVRRGRPEGGQGDDNIGGNPEGQVIVDHCSVSWGMDENISLYRYMKRMPDGSRVKLPAENITIQWCISSEALNPRNHAFGGTWGGRDATFHHNLFACNTGRNPSIGMGGEFDYRNNVIFNWRHRTMDGGDETSLVNVINNYYKPGPATNANMCSTIARIEQRNMYSPGRQWEVGGWYPQAAPRPGKWYVAGNVVEGYPEIAADNWKGMKLLDGDGTLDMARVNSPFEGWPVRQQTAEEAFRSVLAKAGATRPRRDAVDARIIELVRTGRQMTGNGIINDPREVGGYPEYSFCPDDVPVDTDGDGMPDEWEIAYGFDPNDSSDGAQDADGDGYTNVEEYLNGTGPREKIDYRNLGNNIDMMS